MSRAQHRKQDLRAYKHISTYKPAERRCLRCERMFFSQGPSNRRCTSCDSHVMSMRYKDSNFRAVFGS